jgi:hypothetical protein
MAGSMKADILKPKAPINSNIVPKSDIKMANPTMVAYKSSVKP